MSSKKLFDAVFSPISLIVGDKIGHAITGAALIVAGIYTGNLELVSAGIGMEASSFAKKGGGNVNKANVDRLTISLIPNEPAKFVFGQTALATDVRYQTYSGANQEYIDQIAVVAGHQVQSIDEVWFENEKAWTKAGGAQGRFAGYLTITDRPVGTAANGIAIDANWTVNCRLVGRAYLYIRYKLTGNSKKAESPFSSSLPSRVTVRGKSALLYDPRFDGTVAGGAGAQRAADQTTWAYSTGAVESGRNTALQILWVLLGYRIQNPAAGTWKLALGRGMPAARIDLPSFITAANICDEAVALAAGGTEPRYRSDGVFSEADDPGQVLQALLASMNAYLDDSNGKLAIGVYKNDLATPVAYLSEANVLGEELWTPSPEIDQIPNVVRGRFTDASDNALYQAVPYPEVAVASIDGMERPDPFDPLNIQSSAQVQRVAKQRLQQAQYQGRYRAKFDHRAWVLSRGKIVAFSHQGLGWANKPFRVESISIALNGVTSLVLRDENAATYSWAAGETAPVTAAAPTIYNPLNAPLLLGIGEARSTIYRQVSDPVGANAVQDYDMWVELTSPMRTWVRIGGTWQTAANYVTQGADIGVANGATKNTIYRQAGAPGSPIDGDVWVDTSATPNVIKVRVAGAWQNAATNVTSGPDIGVAAGATAARNALLNGTAEGGLLTPWTRDETINGGGTLAVSAVGARTGSWCFRLTKAAGADGLNMLSEAMQVSSAKVYVLRVAIKGDAATGSGLYVRLNEMNSTPAGGQVTVGQRTSLTDFVANGAVANSWTLYEFNYIPPAGVTSVSFSVFNWTGAPTGLSIDDCEFFEAVKLDNQVTGTLPKVSNLPNLAAFGTSYYFTGTISYSASAGTPASATVSVTAGSIVSGSYSLAYNAMSVNVSGTGGTSVTYGLYVSDPNRAGGSATLQTATGGQTLASSDGYILIGVVTVAFPTSGTGSGGGARGGASGGGGGVLP